MSLKTDSSFLRFVTMGAVGALSVIDYLQGLGFQPVELERYCTSNKIWQTKVKRLRLPDLLCVRTGLRFEVRGKSSLAVKMSHSDKTASRAWDAELRDSDLASFVLVNETEPGVFEAPYAPVTFSIADLRASFGDAKLGPPKSASEGAERDLTWPTIVPKSSGETKKVSKKQLTILKFGNPRPNYTYNLNGKTAYVQSGDQFIANASVIAGVIPRIADLASLVAGQQWDVEATLNSNLAEDRFAAAKAAPFVLNASSPALPTLSTLADDPEPRLRLEAAGALARLNQEKGFDCLEDAIDNADAWDDGSLGPEAVRMEAVLILGEVGRYTNSPRVAQALTSTLSSSQYHGDEVRQAAAWNLGRAGTRNYRDLLPFIDDNDEDVALHALCAFGADTPIDVVADLADLLRNGSARKQASAAEILVRLGTKDVATQLVDVAAGAGPGRDWALAGLGRLPLDELDVEVPPELITLIGPVRVLHRENWLREGQQTEAVSFLSSQTLGLGI